MEIIKDNRTVENRRSFFLKSSTVAMLCTVKYIEIMVTTQKHTEQAMTGEIKRNPGTAEIRKLTKQLVSAI